MKYSKNLELDMLFRKYFFLLKKEKINLIKNHNETNYLDLLDGFLESNDLVNFSNDENIKKTTSYEIRAEIFACELVQNDIYYSELCEIIDYSQLDFIYDIEFIKVDENINWDSIFLLFIKKLYEFKLYNSNYSSFHSWMLDKNFNENLDILICDFFLKKEKLKIYKSDFIVFLNSSSSSLIENYILFLSKIIIKEMLYVSFNSKFERKVAHYTNVDVGMLLIRDETKFRLSCTTTMNDPQEGKQLYKFLNNISSTDREVVNSKYYLSCFTFNHNSLNQFRLYGRTNLIECSGISLVFNKKFFFNNENLSVERLYRCIYIDPNSGYIQLACRDKFTFIQEEEGYNNNVEAKWFRYERMIEYKSVYLRSLLALIRHISSQYQVVEAELNFIMGETKYLFKNFCFKDEQECRIIKNSSIKDSKDSSCISSYLVYDGDFFNALSNLYVGEAAYKLTGYIYKIILNQPKFSTTPKIKISEHPYRAIEYLESINGV